MDESKVFQEIRDRIDKEENRLLGTYKEQVKEFLSAARSYHITSIDGLDHAEEIRDYLKAPGNTPSQYFKEHHNLYKGWICDKLLDSFYYAVDNVIYWQHVDNVYRRTLRNGAYEDNVGKIASIIDAFHKDSVFNKDVMGLIKGDFSQEEEIYFAHTYRLPKIHGYLIAAELDRGNKELEDYIEDQILGDGGSVSYEMIRGIMMSKSTRLYDALGKLLVAARLQEGTRQAICENMDCGREEAFIYFYKILIDNDMFRFSSVMRAGATWTGILNTEGSKLERISKKMFELCYGYLTDTTMREEAFGSEDAMEIFLALWAMGCHDGRDSANKARDIFESGTPHQRMVAMYYLLEVHVNRIFVAEAVKLHADETPLMALAIPILKSRAIHCIYGVVGNRYNRYFYAEKGMADKAEKGELCKASFVKDEEDCRALYSCLLDIYKNMKSKKAEFSPIVFPWISATLTKSDIVIIMAYLAAYTSDEEYIEWVLGHLADMEGSYKADVLELLADNPSTKAKRSAVLSMITSADDTTRDVAFHILNTMELSEDEYMILEDALRLKRADMRNEILSILYKRKGQDLMDIIGRLTSAKVEEKRLGGLSLIMMLKKDEDRTSEYETAVKNLRSIIDTDNASDDEKADETDALNSKEDNKAKDSKEKSSKKKSASSKTVKACERTEHEKTIIADILGKSQEDSEAKDELLYDPDASYDPIIDHEFISKCRESFIKVFPDSILANNNDPAGDASLLGKVLKTGKKLVSGDNLASGKNLVSKVLGKERSSGEKEKLIELARSLDDLIDKNKDREYVDHMGQTKLLRDANYLYKRDEDDNLRIIFEDLWEDFYTKSIGSDYPLTLKLLMFVEALDDTPGYEDFFAKAMSDLWGKVFFEKITLKYPALVSGILEHLEKHHRDKKLYFEIGVSAYAFILTEYKGQLTYHYTYISQWSKKEEKAHKTILSHASLIRFGRIYSDYEDYFDKLFPIKYALAQKAELDGEKVYYYKSEYAFKGVSLQDCLKACQLGIISKDFLDKMLWNKDSIQKNSVRIISDYAKNIREKGKAVSKRRYYYGGNDPEHQLFYKDKDKYADRNEALADLVNSCYDKIADVIAESELKRGDLAGEHSDLSTSLTRLYGTEYFVRILVALGKQKIDRATYYSYYSRTAPSRVESLSHLLSICIPKDGEDAGTLKAELKGKKIKDTRLVEAALFVPEWIDIVGDYLGWEGFTSCCYYFMAHMNERFDDKRKAMIAKYTPLSIEDLNRGAFDVEWFKDVYNLIGADRFKIIYDAAKYISDGAKHTRARKYADAALGILDTGSVMKEIEAKRNKDYLMCLGAIPSKKASDIKDRYLFIRKFEKESKKFGAQRRASEKICSEMAIKNMATAVGYQDEMRFVLRMESKISEGLLSFFDPKQVDDIEVKLELDANGKLVTVVNKGGKKLKAIPAKLKKDDYILELAEAKKTLQTQGSRSKTMFEEAMEEETVFSIGELRDLSKSPVIGPVIRALVLKAGDEYGFLDELEHLEDDTEVLIAHPWHLYKSGVWREYQKKIFDMELRQPFKQVFRELYIKTKDEMEEKLCNRFAGNQIQPKRTLALLKTRRWIADMEDGLQKVYYKKNIISSIYALADWFSPSDIEEPTLEWVVFYDRKNFKQLKISDVPDILFSETMRDVDLAVSVAHAGGVDPEFSHSTIEMRRAIAEFTLPLFKLSNVTFAESHALIKGTRASYSLHLGSGVIHQEGGPMINILPVHSQRRGKIFLPFVDDDPKTAEIISKLLFLAEDQKIKDPFILQQIK